jgi:cytidylate kinase
MKKQMITIAGKPGSGKSTTAKSVARTLGYEHFSSGDLFREISTEMGVDVLATNLIAEKNKEIDERVDSKLREIGQSHRDLVVDSRTAWHWIPESFKVFLDLDLETAARRILGTHDDQRIATEQTSGTVDEYATSLQMRLESESKRYKSLYGIDVGDLGNYDLIVDTGSNDVDTVVKTIIDAYQKWIDS